jgi:hypothetical protein
MCVLSDTDDEFDLVEGLTEPGRRLHSLMAGVAAYDRPDDVRDLVGESGSIWAPTCPRAGSIR